MKVREFMHGSWVDYDIPEGTIPKGVLSLAALVTKVRGEPLIERVTRDYWIKWEIACYDKYGQIIGRVAFSRAGDPVQCTLFKQFDLDKIVTYPYFRRVVQLTDKD